MHTYSVSDLEVDIANKIVSIYRTQTKFGDTVCAIVTIAKLQTDVKIYLSKYVSQTLTDEDMEYLISNASTITYLGKSVNGAFNIRFAPDHEKQPPSSTNND